MFLLAMVFCVSIVWGTCPAHADQPQDDSGADIASFVEQLDSSTRTERETAERKLLERGPRLLPHLPRTSPQPAVQAALTRIRRQLEHEQASVHVHEPTRFSFTRSGSLGEVFESNEDTALPRLHFNAEQAMREVNIDAEEVPYWRLMDNIGQQTSLWPDEWEPTRGLAWRDRTDVDDRRGIGYSGVFRVAAGPVERRTLQQDEKQFLYRIPLELRAEPRIRPLFLRLIAKNATLKAPDETTLSPFTPDATYEIPIGRTGGIATHQLDFVGGEIPGDLTLAIQLRATVATTTEKFEFSLERTKFERTTKRQGAVEVELRRRKWLAPDTLEVEMGVLYRGDVSAFESYRTWVYHNDVILGVHRGNGETIAIAPEPAFDTIAESPGALRLRYLFKNVPADATAIHFTYEAPTQVLEVPMEVEIPGVKLE